MSRLVYISRNYKTQRHAGGKARVDVEDILSADGALNLGLRRTFSSNKVVDYFRNLAGITRFMMTIRRGDIIVVQYPLKKYYRLVCRQARRRGAKVVTLVHDLGSFRRRRLTVDEEIAKLSLSDVVVAANQSTIKWLRDNGFKKPLVEQVAWDYLSDSRPEPGIDPERLSLAYVGNLNPERDGFLYKLPATMSIDLYGDGPVDAGMLLPKERDNGFVEPDTLIASARGRFGLIWYGPSTTEHVGFIGEYIGLCNTHKLSLYMRAGKPVVLWRGAGQAPFVEREGVGLTVDSLDDLDAKLAAVTDEQYERMRANVDRVAALMASGHYLRSALSRSLAALDRP